MSTASTRAVAALTPGPVDAPDSFREIDLPLAPLGPHDLLVEVRAVSVNPVDTKRRTGFDAADGPLVLGYDAAGIVVEAGQDVRSFSVGDEVWYAGSIARPGSNADRQVVDERIVGRKPSSLTFAEAAAMPLTTITAWEALFERLRVTSTDTGTLLVMGGGGGTGTMMIQLARQLTGLTVIATASRDASRTLADDMGAHRVIDHRGLGDELTRVAPDGLDYVFSNHSAGNIETYAEHLKVRGAVVAIDDASGLDMTPFKRKSQTWMWEYMFTEPLYAPEGATQHALLSRAADLVDRGVLRTNITETLSPLNADTIREAHAMVETGSMVGKVVVERV
ncbi:zinc-binding alcohol dehydrogenase family protein [Rhodococcus sp. HNM0569]|uniref:zinc-binding alcohol dehydrogenase family protein n=1 Tax=Rhodococcus sp. HNM0569 TaxID=2716340 RepID=UPI00146EB118|nr:zinc-binding alcohol dehydrogenase family protein [Rhodococcus sp. HNM0569]NLU83440.1 zinc-binding alcohol dehydrogenase family protein [Rhodococcus sp. HNM0569]